MRLPKAKEILQLNVKELGKKMPPDCRDALLIAIEAIDYIERQRKLNPGVAFTILVGEDYP